jgi:deoxyribodipyrimidine photo-lyase
LETFITTGLAEYSNARDILSVAGCSGLSAALTYGEISPATVWHRVWAAGEQGNRGAEAFLRQLGWRDFAWHLYWHHPDLGSQEWRPDWQSFDWGREVTPEVLAWQQGRTGIEVVDAGMRELYTTGYMHNRVRMIAASYLTKHLRADWRIGLRWFEDCLVDWDPASNAMGWQWVAGCGPEAAPYFRVFNPDTQADKFDRDHSYRRRWIAEGQAAPPQTALDFYEAIPRRWALAPDNMYPAPVVGLSEGRKAALVAYERWKSAKAGPQS